MKYCKNVPRIIIKDEPCKKKTKGRWHCQLPKKIAHGLTAWAIEISKYYGISSLQMGLFPLLTGIRIEIGSTSHYWANSNKHRIDATRLVLVRRTLYVANDFTRRRMNENSRQCEEADKRAMQGKRTSKGLPYEAPLCEVWTLDNRTKRKD